MSTRICSISWTRHTVFCCPELLHSLHIRIFRHGQPTTFGQMVGEAIFPRGRMNIYLSLVSHFHPENGSNLFLRNVPIHWLLYPFFSAENIFRECHWILYTCQLGAILRPSGPALHGVQSSLHCSNDLSARALRHWNAWIDMWRLYAETALAPVPACITPRLTRSAPEHALVLWNLKGHHRVRFEVLSLVTTKSAFFWGCNDLLGACLLIVSRLYYFSTPKMVLVHSSEMSVNF
jgi:hypothetical protein